MVRRSACSDFLFAMPYALCCLRFRGFVGLHGDMVGVLYRESYLWSPSILTLRIVQLDGEIHYYSLRKSIAFEILMNSQTRDFFLGPYKLLEVGNVHF